MASRRTSSRGDPSASRATSQAAPVPIARTDAGGSSIGAARCSWTSGWARIIRSRWGSPTSRKRRSTPTRGSTANTPLLRQQAGEADFTRPFRVTIENSPRTTTNNLLHRGAYLQDQINVSPNITVNAGIRWDYYHVFYPDMEIREGRFRDFFYAGAALPTGYVVPASYPSFQVPARDNIVKFTKGFAPRAGVAWDLRADGKTVLKANWGRYKANPGPQASSTRCSASAAPSAGTIGTAIASSRSTKSAPSSAAAAAREHDQRRPRAGTDDVSFFVERELMKNLSARAGYVKKIGKNNWQSVELARTYNLFTNVRTFGDPGPDGLTGTPDDGAPFTAFDIPANVALPASLTDLRTQPRIESWDRNIDITVNKRMSNRWSMLTSFLYNWDHEKGAPQTPNGERFNETDLTSWAFKLLGRIRRHGDRDQPGRAIRPATT
jgi:hypothetical protein